MSLPSAAEPAAPAKAKRSLPGSLKLPLGLVALLWAVEAADWATGQRLDDNGIHPHDPDRWWGIFSAPFLHGDFDHLISNSVPMVVMGVMIALAGALRLLMVSAVALLVSGIGVWLVGSSGQNHIGASGVVFGYMGYLICRGLFDRRPLHLLLGLVVALVYGGALLGGLVPQPEVSWQGHLFGALGGVIAAALFSRGSRKDKTSQETAVKPKRGKSKKGDSSSETGSEVDVDDLLQRLKSQP